MYFLDMNIMVKFIRWLMAVFCGWIYPLISFLFNLFMNISKVNILESQYIKPIYLRVTMILTIIMIFYVTFEFVKFVVQPDGITDKEKGVGKIVYKMVIVVALIAFVPTIFSGAFKLQTAIMKNGIIGNVILGTTTTEPDKFGSTFSAELLSLFYMPKEGYEEEDCDDVTCGTVVTMNLFLLKEHNDLSNLTIGLSSTKEVPSHIAGEDIEVALIDFSFNGLMPLAVGIFVAYILILYCIDLGTRWAQLVYLQIIAPIPIIGYLTPQKDGIFQKWYKQAITTYLDLFIRTAIIYFVLLITSILMDGYRNGKLMENVDSDMRLWVYIALVLGLLLFAKKAPELLKELFPKTNAASGNFGLKAGERVAPLAARALGAGLGATRFLGGAIARAANRHMRNKANGAKSLLTEKGRQQFRDRMANRAEAGRQKDNLKAKERMNSRVSEEQMSQAKGKVKAAAQKAAEKKAEITKQFKEKGLEGDALDAAVRAEMRKTQEQKDLDAASREYRALNRERYALKEDENGKLYSEDKDIQKMRTQIKEQSDRMQENEEYQEALAKLNEARDKGNEEDIKKAQEAFDQVKQEQMEENGLIESGLQYSEMINGSIHETEAKLSDALDRVAKDDNERYRSVIGAGASGAISGAWTGVTTGFQATKLEDVWKKGVTETVEKDVKNIKAVDKYYDEGGRGFWDRTLTQATKTILPGIDTAYKETTLQTQARASKIKTYDQTIARSDNLKKSFDSTEDRLKSKIAESKVVAETTPNGNPIMLKDGKGTATDIAINSGESIRDFNHRYRQGKIQADARSEEASKNQQAKMSVLQGDARELAKAYEGRSMDELSEAEKRAHDEKLSHLSKEDQEAYLEYKNAEQEAAERAHEATLAADAQEAAVKYGARYTMTLMLQGKVPDSQVDNVAKQELEDMKNHAAIARQDPAIFGYIQSHLAELSLSSSDFGAFVSGRYYDYDQLDRIKNAVNEVRKVSDRDKQIVQDEKTRLESSHVTQAQKAADEYNGGSGK